MQLLLHMLIDDYGKYCLKKLPEYVEIFLILHNSNVNDAVIYISTTLLIIAIRLVAVKFKLSLPTFYTKE